MTGSAPDVGFCDAWALLLGLVDGQRQGRHIVYTPYDNHVSELIDQALYHTEHLRLGATDRPATQR